MSAEKAEKEFVVSGLSFINPQTYPDVVQLNLTDEKVPWGGSITLNKNQVAALRITIGDKVKITISKSP